MASKKSLSSKTYLVVAVALVLTHLPSTWSAPCQSTPKCDCLPVGGPPNDVLEMTCSERGLTEFPDLSAYSKLEILDVPKNLIATIPDDAFKHQTNLKSLKFFDNRLSVFPSVPLKNLTKLTVLNAGDNPYTNSHVDIDTFSGMTEMHDFDVSSLLFRDLPGLNITLKHVYSMTKVFQFHINSSPVSRDNIESWDPTEIGQRFTLLRKLSLSGNALREIPRFAAALPDLEDLIVSFNLITNIEPGSVPQAVDYLLLSSNFISTLHNGVLPANLQTLRMFSNPLRLIDFEAFKNVPHLRVLHAQYGETLSSCELIDGRVSCQCAPGLVRSPDGDACTVCPRHPPRFADVACVSGLEGARCEARCGGFVQSLNQQPDVVHGLNTTTFVCLAKGSWTIDGENAVQDCELQICGPTSPCVCRNTTVDCRRAALKTVPGGFPRWVTEIDLSENHITAVPELAFDELPDLVHVNLSHNAITFLGNAAFTSRSLNELDLSHNKLTQLINEPFPPYFGISHLDLSYNSIHTISSPRTLMFTLADRYMEHGKDGTDTKTLIMDGNPTQCLYRFYSTGNNDVYNVECNCDALNTTRLPFCPTNATDFRFRCQPTDAKNTISTASVCDGVPDCVPSGYDEQVCQGRLGIQRASSSICYAKPAPGAQFCRRFNCLNSISVTVRSGIARLEFTPGCDRYCPITYGLVTGNALMLGGSDSTVISFDGRQSTVINKLILVNEKTAPLTGECGYDLAVVEGNPLGIADVPYTPPTSTAFDSTLSTTASSSQPVFTSQTSTATESPPTGDPASSAALSLGSQIAIVACVCLVLGSALLVTGFLLYRIRAKHIDLTNSWLEDQRPGTGLHTQSGGSSRPVTFRSFVADTKSRM